MDAARRTALEVRRRRPAPAPGAAAAPADLDRRFGQARAAARRAASATAGSRRRRRSTGSPTTSRTSCASATRCGRARCPRSAITACVYVGEPTWELPKFAMNGNDRDHRLAINELGAIGVSHVQVRFARAVGRRAVRPGRARSAPRSARTSRASRSDAETNGRDALPLHAPRLPRPRVRPRVGARDLRGRARAVRVGRSHTASTCSCSRSTTASTTAGCRRR